MFRNIRTILSFVLQQSGDDKSPESLYLLDEYVEPLNLMTAYFKWKTK